MTPHPVLVVGDLNVDLVVRGDVVPRFGQAEQLLDAAELVLGGSAAIVACGLARLGVPTRLAAVVGDDEFGRAALAALAAAGVETDAVRVDPSAPTGISVILSGGGDRAILTLPGTIPALTTQDVQRALERDPAWVHVASPFLMPALTAALPPLLADRHVSLDTNWDPAEEWIAVVPLLEQVDVLLPNRAELKALGGVADLAALGVHVVVKDGAAGGWSLAPDGTRSQAPGLRVVVVDTTGAGDSFDAGYLAAIAHGVEDEAARLRWATVAGSLSTRGAGGTAEQATLHELRAHL